MSEGEWNPAHHHTVCTYAHEKSGADCQCSFLYELEGRLADFHRKREREREGR